MERYKSFAFYEKIYIQESLKKVLKRFFESYRINHLQNKSFINAIIAFRFFEINWVY